MHRTERYWPDPERFDPDRFLPEARAARLKFTYFPFGGGPRVCIGERFAMMEATLILATIGQQWSFRHDPAHRVATNPQITLRPRYGMRMIAARVVA
jgi:cytochrome P450